MSTVQRSPTLEWSVSSMSPADRTRWEGFVEDHSEGTLYHLPAWSDLLHQCYGFQPICLALEADDGTLDGILPLALVASPVTGRRLVSLPCTNTAGPLGRPEIDPERLVSAAIDVALRERCRYVEIRGRAARDGYDLQPLVRHDYYGTFILNLQENGRAGSTQVDKRARRGVTRAAREGVEVRFLDDRTAPDVFYRLNLLTRRKHGVPPQPLTYFQELWSTLRPRNGIEILAAEYQGKAVASIVLTIFKDTVTYAYGASDVDYLRHSPNHALFNAALTWARDRGYRCFDFGRTAPDNEGLMEFKRQWGATFVPLPYFYWPGRGGFVSESEGSWKHRLFTMAWRRLPLPVTAVVGPPLYRHLV